MLAANIPVKIPTIFASSAPGGDVTAPFPNTSQPNGLASWPTGFVPSNFSAIAAGGIPPWGKDFNGLFQIVSAWIQWITAGGAPVAYDSSFQTTIGGYPNGAIVGSATYAGLYWISTVDSNTTNPDAGGAGWFAFPYNRGGLAIGAVGSNTFTVPAHVFAFHFRLYGGGGGGGGSSNSGTGPGAGAGGNGGAYVEGWVTNATPGSNYTIVVGGGGAGGVANNGQTGAPTTLLSPASVVIAQATGGGGGGAGISTGGATGSSASFSGGFYGSAGDAGSFGTIYGSSSAQGGMGGGIFGVTAIPPLCTTGFLNGTGGGPNPGNAGSGSASVASVNATGGNGSNGAAVFDW